LQLADYPGHGTPDGIQRLLASGSWDPDELRDDVREFVVGRLGEPDGVQIVDDTGFAKKGVTSAGGGRRYIGHIRKGDHCRMGVFAAYASCRRRALAGRMPGVVVLGEGLTTRPGRRGISPATTRRVG
jgi:hypothetical protein